MKTTEAARYARWAAGAAILILAVVAGDYAHRAWRASRVRRAAPRSVPATVEQQSAQFSFSKVVQNRTLFTVRASRATEFKDQDRSLLEDVWITIYGQAGLRNDNIHTQFCSYEPATGGIRCEGEVQIDLENAEQARQPENQQAIQVVTRDITFDRNTGVAASDQPVAFRMPFGTGRATGILYNARAGAVVLQRNVELKLVSSTQPNALPILLAGRRLEYEREGRILQLLGPASARQGDTELTAGRLSLELDPAFHPRRFLAQETPEITSAGPKGEFSVAAGNFVAQLDSTGRVERILAEGGVRGTRKGSVENDTFSAQSAEIAIDPQENQPREIIASGNAEVAASRQGFSRRLEASVLELNFVAVEGNPRRRLSSAETLGPGAIELNQPGEITEIRASRFTAAFDSGNRLTQLLGEGSVGITRRLGVSEPQFMTAQNFSLQFGDGGEWEKIVESGDVHFRQGDRTAEAQQATFSRVNDLIELAGSPVVADAASRTSAGAIEINERTSEIRASGGVLTTYPPASRESLLNLAPALAHISAAALEASNPSGLAIYSGHARLWQGDAILEADTITLRREPQQMEAQGSVSALFPQAPARGSRGATPILWSIHTPHLRYWGQDARAELDGGVTVHSTEGALQSRTLLLFLARAGGGPQQIERAIATGGVDIRLGGRRATAERAEYTAKDGKFVLSGGQPMLFDAYGDTTLGHELTFFVANDTILVDSQSGARTLTKHRVEK